MPFETQPCPYDGTPCEADWVDVEVGFVQCGPYHCECGASEIGPCDRYISEGRLSSGLYRDIKRNLEYGWRFFVQAQYAHIHRSSPFTFEESMRISGCRIQKLTPYRHLTAEENECGWYAPDSPAGTSANTIGGQIVGHKQALAAYRADPEGYLQDQETYRPPERRSVPDSPYAVRCVRHGKVCLSPSEYNRQMRQADSRWQCPYPGCRREASWDDQHYEERMNADDDAGPAGHDADGEGRERHGGDPGDMRGGGPEVRPLPF